MIDGNRCLSASISVGARVDDGARSPRNLLLVMKTKACNISETAQVRTKVTTTD